MYEQFSYTSNYLFFLRLHTRAFGLFHLALNSFFFFFLFLNLINLLTLVRLIILPQINLSLMLIIGALNIQDMH